MFGGPWLGLIAFIVIAIGLGWGLTKLFQGMIDHTRETLEAEDLAHAFEDDVAYALQKDMLIGRRASGDPVLVPFKEDMPRGAPGRYTWPTQADYANDTEAYSKSHDLVGLAKQGTLVQFVEVIEDHDNAQTRVLVMARLLTGPYARKTPVLGMYLEKTDTDEVTGQRRYVPRADLFEIAVGAEGPVQSQVDSEAG